MDTIKKETLEAVELFTCPVFIIDKPEYLDVTRKDLYALTRKTCRECVGEEGSVVDCTNEECTLHKHRLKAIEEVQ